MEVLQRNSPSPCQLSSRSPLPRPPSRPSSAPRVRAVADLILGGGGGGAQDSSKAKAAAVGAASLRPPLPGGEPALPACAPHFYDKRYERYIDQVVASGLALAGLPTLPKPELVRERSRCHYRGFQKGAECWATPSRAQSLATPSRRESLEATMGSSRAPSPAMASSSGFSKPTAASIRRKAASRDIIARQSSFQQDPGLKKGDTVTVIHGFATSGDPQALRVGLQGEVRSVADDGETCIYFQRFGRIFKLDKSKMKYLLADEASRATSAADLAAYEALVENHQEKLPPILDELRKAMRRSDEKKAAEEQRIQSLQAVRLPEAFPHWWVFPATQAATFDGSCSRVTKVTAKLLLDTPTVKDWQTALEIVCKLVEREGTEILPDQASYRVSDFISFWSQLEGCPLWLKAVCKRLQECSG
eukprot:TRINITY_DN28636_c0_g1_i1.p1 TRINITY_DN28636_c0_g1~~TRINITY_DN28636_c0_g1_i1.p1  ORF type:complete len:418 (-),score=72.27 TRINITY_DN28636_c0_g1_i1:388-1641(-)